MAIVLSLVLGFVVVVFLAVVGVLVNRNIKSTQNLQQLIIKQEGDRVAAKRNGLFARVFRELNRPEGFIPYTYQRVEFNIMELYFGGGVSINIAVRENLGSFERGQLVACAKGHRTIHSCEEDIKIFVKHIRLEVRDRRSA